MMLVELVKLDDEIEQTLMADVDYRDALRDARWADAAQRIHAVVGTKVPSSAVTIDEPTWGWYYAAEPVTRNLIGSCAYKSAPTEDGTVEIAYFTYPPFEGRGWATAMARRLIDLAGRSPAVRRVIAHTLPARGASTRVLEKVGMSYAGEVIDPEDGPVWQWRIDMGDE